VHGSAGHDHIRFVQYTRVPGVRSVLTETTGLHVAVYFMTVRAIWTSSSPRLRACLLTSFVSSLFVCGTLFVAKENLMLKWAFIDYRNFQGGPGALLPILGDVEPRSFDFANPVALTITALADAMLVRNAAHASLKYVDVIDRFGAVGSSGPSDGFSWLSQEPCGSYRWVRRSIRPL
jgi:hypothetical protein